MNSGKAFGSAPPLKNAEDARVVFSLVTRGHVEWLSASSEGIRKSPGWDKLMAATRAVSEASGATKDQSAGRGA